MDGRDVFTIYLAIVRFTHIGAGIVWIGILYYFNFIQVPSFAKMDPAARTNAVLNLVPRALLWFRHAAWVTMAAGLLWAISYGTDIGWDTYFKTSNFKSILIGGTMGIIMAANVWFIIWPNQKKVIAAVRATAEEGTPAPAEQPQWARMALLASRTNTMLSIPMLFFMIGAAHLAWLWR